jgi:hypothetical protein
MGSEKTELGMSRHFFFEISQNLLSHFVFSTIAFPAQFQTFAEFKIPLFRRGVSRVISGSE